MGLDKHWTCNKTTSLEYLNSSDFQGFDLYLLDGDHNYFTLYKELCLIHRRSKPGDIIIMHDVMKWGRHDQYYDESNIPLDYLYGKKQGLLTAIEDFIVTSSYITYKRWRNNRVPFYKDKIQNWSYNTITKEQYGLGMLKRM